MADKQKFIIEFVATRDASGAIKTKLLADAFLKYMEGQSEDLDFHKLLTEAGVEAVLPGAKFSIRAQ
jgi:hypothetical protein